MIFLIEYDRTHSQTTFFQNFPDAELTQAQSARIEREVAANQRSLSLEIVLLEAKSEETLRRTHARYFEHVNSPEVATRLLNEALSEMPQQAVFRLA